jgi:class 3 adenylate cyclase
MPTSNPPTLEAVLADLEQKKQELNLVLGIDHIRDTVKEPLSMLSAIVTLLAQSFSADLCLLSLVDRETQQVELKAIQKRTHNNHLDPLINRELAEEAIRLAEIQIWKSDDEILRHHQLPQGLELAAVPIIMGNHQVLGTLMLGRVDQPFQPAEVHCLKTVETSVDSAIIQGYEFHEMEQHTRELEAIYRIDHIRDHQTTFEGMLHEVLNELQTSLQAEMAMVMLYDRDGQKLEMRATTHQDLFRLSPYHEIVEQLANQALQSGKLVWQNHLNSKLASMMCLPLILNERIIGVLGVANGPGRPLFNSYDRRLLSAIGSQIDTAIFESMEKRHLREVLGRSVDPRVMTRLLESSETDFLKGERRVLSVLYADVRGSTSLAESTEPELLVGFINDYLGRMTDVVLENEGTLDKFVGDEVMALFGAPFPQEDHALRAVQTGLAMQKAHRDIMKKWRKAGVDAAPIGVGIATGELIVGEMGSHKRTDYTVIGRAANLGARICSVAQGGQVLISPTTYQFVEDQIDALPVDGLEFKGVQGRMTVYQVLRVLD